MRNVFLMLQKDLLCTIEWPLNSSDGDHERNQVSPMGMCPDLGARSPEGLTVLPRPGGSGIAPSFSRRRGVHRGPRDMECIDVCKSAWEVQRIEDGKHKGGLLTHVVALQQHGRGCDIFGGQTDFGHSLGMPDSDTDLRGTVSGGGPKASGRVRKRWRCLDCGHFNQSNYSRCSGCHIVRDEQRYLEAERMQPLAAKASFNQLFGLRNVARSSDEPPVVQDGDTQVDDPVEGPMGDEASLTNGNDSSGEGQEDLDEASDSDCDQTSSHSPLSPIANSVRAPLTKQSAQHWVS